MWRPGKRWEEFEGEQLARHLSFEERLRIAEQMFDHAVESGVFPRKDPLEGLQHVIETARKIRLLRGSSRKSE